MIEIKLGALRDPLFQEALQKLKTSTEPSFPIRKDIAKIVSKIKHEGEIAQGLFESMVKKYGSIDEKTQSFKIDDDKLSDYHKELKEYSESTFTIEKEKIDVNKLEKVSLSSGDLVALQPLLGGLDL